MRTPVEPPRVAGSRGALGSLFTRFTADRDSLYVQIQECQRSLAALRARVDAEPRGSGEPPGPALEPELRRQREALQEATRQATRALIVAKEAFEATGRLSAELETRLQTLGAQLESARTEPAADGSAQAAAIERTLGLAEEALRANQLPGLQIEVTSLRDEMAELVRALAVLAAQPTPKDAPRDSAVDDTLRPLREQLEAMRDQAAVDRAACHAGARKALHTAAETRERLEPVRAELTALGEVVRLQDGTLVGLRGELTRLAETAQETAREMQELERRVAVRLNDAWMAIRRMTDNLLRLVADSVPLLRS